MILRFCCLVALDTPSSLLTSATVSFGKCLNVVVALYRHRPWCNTCAITETECERTNDRTRHRKICVSLLLRKNQGFPNWMVTSDLLSVVTARSEVGMSFSLLNGNQEERRTSLLQLRTVAITVAHDYSDQQSAICRCPADIMTLEHHQSTGRRFGVEELHF